MNLKSAFWGRVPDSVKALYWRLRNLFEFGRADRVAVFSRIYNRNLWGDSESVSGGGSTLSVTAVFRAEFESWLREANIGVILDIPCGDFNWMRHVEFPDGLKYIGVDVVPELIARVSSQHSGTHVSFRCGDILTDDLPGSDAVLCKDLFIHFPNVAIRQAILNVKKSGAQFLLATTFPSTRKNVDIRFGSARRTNLEFLLGPPVKLLRDFGGGVNDRYVGVWDLRLIPVSLIAR